MTVDTGSVVFWIDPDNGLCSSVRTVIAIRGDIYELSGDTEALASELVKIWHGTEGVWAEHQGVLYGPYATENLALETLITMHLERQ